MEPAEKKRGCSVSSSSFPLMRLPSSNICGVIEFLGHLDRISTMKVSKQMVEINKRYESPKCHGIIDISALSLEHLKLAHTAFKYMKPMRLVLAFNGCAYSIEEKSERTQLVDDIIEDHGKNLLFLSVDLIRFPFRKGIHSLNKSLEHLQLVPYNKAQLDIKKLSSLEHLKILTIKDDGFCINSIITQSAVQLPSITTLDLGNNPSMMLPMQLLPSIPNLKCLTIGCLNQNIANIITEIKSLNKLNIRCDIVDIPLLEKLNDKIINQLILDIGGVYFRSYSGFGILFEKLSKYRYVTHLSLTLREYRILPGSANFNIFISSESIKTTFKQLIGSRIRFVTGYLDAKEIFETFNWLMAALTPLSLQSSERFSIDVSRWGIRYDNFDELLQTGKVSDIRFCSYYYVPRSPLPEMSVTMIIDGMRRYNIPNGCICGGTSILCEKIKKELGTSVSHR